MLLASYIKLSIAVWLKYMHEVMVYLPLLQCFRQGLGHCLEGHHVFPCELGINQVTFQWCFDLCLSVVMLSKMSASDISWLVGGLADPLEVGLKKKRKKLQL